MTDAASLTAPDPAAAEAVITFSYIIQNLIADEAAEHRFTNTQLRAFAILRDRSLTMGELGQIMNLEKSSVTILVNRAVAAGLIRRTPSERDRRAIHVTLTAKGHAIDKVLRARITDRVFALIRGAMSERQGAEFVRRVCAIVDPLLPEFA